MSQNQFKPGTLCRVIEGFKSDLYDELSMSIGDIVVIEAFDDDTEIKQMKPGYLKGVDRNLGPNNGKIGYFPARCVEAESTPEDLMSSGGSAALRLPQISNQEYQTSGQNILRNDSENSSLVGDGAQDAGDVPLDQEAYQDQPQEDAGYDQATLDEMQRNVSPGSKVLVKFRYEAQKSDELDLYVDDIAVVTHCPEGGWWRGALWTNSGLGQVGWFPMNFVELLSDDVPLPSPIQDNQKSKKDISEENSGKQKKKSFWQRKTSSKTGILESLVKGSEKHEDEDFTSQGSINQNNQDSDDVQTPNSENYGSLTKKSINMFKRLTSQTNVLSTVPQSARESKVFPKGSLGSDQQYVISTPSPQAIEVMNSKARPEKTSWKDGLSQKQIDSLTPREQKRQQVIWELYVTEGAYIRDLKMVIEVFMKPMIDKKLLALKNVEAIFSNIEKLHYINESFYKQLQKLYEENEIIDQFGLMFISSCDQFTAYTSYCSNNSKALQKIKEFNQGNKALAKFLQDCYQLPATRHLDLASYLLKPVQRICKYPLFLLEIIKATSSAHSDRRNLEIALAKLQNVMMVINEGVDGIQRINEIQNSFVDKVQLVSPTRYLVREDQLSILLPPPESKQKPRVIFLFNDVLVIAKKDWREKFYLNAQADIDRVQINEMQNDARNMMEIVFKADETFEEERFIFVFNNKTQKDKWIASWKNLLSAGIMSKIPESSIVDLSQTSQDRNSKKEVGAGQLKPLRVMELTHQNTENQNKLSPGNLSKSRVLASSKRSLASNNTTTSKQGRQRSYSLDNDKSQQSVQLSQQLLDKSSILARSRARSLSEGTREDLDMIKRSMADMKSQASINMLGAKGNDKSEVGSVNNSSSVIASKSALYPQGIPIIQEPIDLSATQANIKSALEPNIPKTSQGIQTRPRKLSVGKEDYDRLKEKLDESQIILGQKDYEINTLQDKVQYFEQRVKTMELELTAEKLFTSQQDQTIKSLQKELQSSLNKSQVDGQNKNQDFSNINQQLLEQQALIENLNRQLQLEQNNSKFKDAELQRLQQYEIDSENEILELQKKDIEKDQLIKQLQLKSQKISASAQSISAKDNEIKSLKQQLNDVEERWKKQMARSRHSSMDKLARTEFKNALSQNNLNDGQEKIPSDEKLHVTDKASIKSPNIYTVRESAEDNMLKHREMATQTENDAFQLTYKEQLLEKENQILVASNTINELKNKVSSTEQSLKELGDRNSQQNNEHSRIRKEMTDAYRKAELDLAKSYLMISEQKKLIETLEKEKSELSNHMKKVMVDFDQFRQQLKFQEEACKNLQKEKVNIIQSYESAIQSEKEQVEDLENQLASIKLENDGLIQKLRYSDSNYGQKLQSLKVQNDMLQQSFQEKRQELLESQLKLQSLQQNLEEVEKSYMDVKLRMQDKDQQLQFQSNSNESLSNQLNEVRTQMEEYKTLNLKFKSQIGILNRAATLSNAAIEDHKRDIDNLRNEIKDKNYKIFNLEELLSKESHEVKQVLAVQMTQLNDQLENVKQQLFSKESELNQLKTLEELDKKLLSEQNEQIEQLKIELKNISVTSQSEQNSLKLLNSQLQDELRSLKVTFEQHQSQLKKADDSLQRLQSEFNRKVQENDVLMAKIKQLQYDQQKFTLENTSSNEKIDSLKAKHRSQLEELSRKLQLSADNQGQLEQGLKKINSDLRELQDVVLYFIQSIQQDLGIQVAKSLQSLNLALVLDEIRDKVKIKLNNETSELKKSNEIQENLAFILLGSKQNLNSDKIIQQAQQLAQDNKFLKKDLESILNSHNQQKQISDKAIEYFKKELQLKNQQLIQSSDEAQRLQNQLNEIKDQRSNNNAFEEIKLMLTQLVQDQTSLQHDSKKIMNINTSSNMLHDVTATPITGNQDQILIDEFQPSKQSRNFTYLQQKVQELTQEKIRIYHESQSQIQVLKDSLAVAKQALDRVQKSIDPIVNFDGIKDEIKKIHTKLDQNLGNMSQTFNTKTDKIKLTDVQSHQLSQYLKHMSNIYEKSIKMRDKDIQFLKSEIQFLLRERT